MSVGDLSSPVPPCGAESEIYGDEIMITNLIKKDAADTESNQIGLRSVRKMVEMHQGELYTFVETNIYTVQIIFELIHKYSGVDVREYQ